jgi:hypothetical protein
VFSLVAMTNACMFTTGRGPSPIMSVMFITRDPPPDRVEKVSVRPSDDAVWIGGHWSGRGNSYVWTPGRWQRPEAGAKEWESGKWVREQRGWYYVEGHWQ